MIGPNVERGYIRSRGVQPEIFIRFQYNPNKITDKRAVSYAAVNTPGQILPFKQYTGGGDRVFTFSVEIAGVLAGREPADLEISVDNDGSIVPELRKYQALVYPRTSDWQRAGRSFASLYADTQLFQTPPTCLFGLGDRVVDCYVSDLSIDETMFNAGLKPLRATVKLTLVELAPYGGPLTPTLGDANAG